MKRIVFIIAVVALGLITVTACGQKKEKKNMTENKTLVAYFSATGTTESLAKKIATATGGELYKITPRLNIPPRILTGPSRLHAAARRTLIRHPVLPS